jgi:hypothetical protein
MGRSSVEFGGGCLSWLVIDYTTLLVVEDDVDGEDKTRKRFI